MTDRITAAMCARGRALSDPRLAPDGSTVAFVASGAGGAALMLVPSSGGPEVVLTTDPPVARGWGVFDWLPGGEDVVYVGAGGALLVQPVGGGPPRRLAGTRGAAAPAVAPDGARVAYTVDGRHVAVASLDPYGPWPVRLSAAPDFCVDPAWSPDGTTVAWHEWDVPAMAWDASKVVLASASAASSTAPSVPTAVPVGPSGTGSGPSAAAVAQPRFAPDGSGLGFLCDAHGWLNLWRSGVDGTGATVLVEEPFEHGGPTWGPGARTWAWSPDGTRIAFTRNEAGFGRLCLLDVATGVVDDVDRGVFDGLSWSADRLVALRSGARTPDQLVVYPGLGRPDPDPPEPIRPAAPTVAEGRPVGAGIEQGRPVRVTVARGPVAGFEAAGLVEPEIVHWVGAEVDGIGSEVHGRLFRTARSVGGTAPLVVWLHGGPTGQHQVGFNPRAAFLLDRGWNILQVDPRGSTGWGRAYTQALTGLWGRLDVDDTVAAIRAAACRGWGDPGRIVLMGGSSAGLTVLSVLAHHPGLCAAGIDFYGVTDLFALDDTTHRFEAHYNPIMLGPLPAAAGEWRDRSPISYCDDITDPLLVLHGNADNVVQVSQSERLVASLVARRAPVEFHVFEGEGHGWSRPESVAEELNRIEDFLTRHVLRGRRT